MSEQLKILGGETTYKYNHPKSDGLECFTNHQTEPYLIELICPEFTSLCPKTGQPDFANIIIRYVPDKRCVESKALKLYLFSFRQFGEFHENCVNRIAKDIMKATHAFAVEVKGEFFPRGGIKIWPKVTLFQPKLTKAKRAEIENILRG